MYSLENLFANSAHKKSIFTQDEINFVEGKIYLKNDKPYIKCAIRNKEIKLTPEETVRQIFLYRLMKIYGYTPAQIKLEHPIHFGREVKKADIVIFEEDRPTSEYIIVEVKKPKLSEGKEQLKSYVNATGATMGVWTNGEKISFYHRKDPNYFEDIPDLPRRGQKLKDILRERWTIDDLVAKDKLATENKTLSNLIVEMEDEVLANAGVDVFEEVFKLIYTKLYDEMMSTRDKSRNLEFRNYGDTDSDLKEVIQNLFDKAKKKWQGVFPHKDKIKLTPSHLAICISSLQNVKLFNSNLEIIDDAFEYLMSKSQKGEKGQFFTPRYVIDMCVKMLNPQKFETMIDTAAGSCGFPVHTIFYVWKNILAEKNIRQSHLFTAEQKPLECEEYVNEKVFAIDFDEKAVRVARTLNLIAGDGRTNVLHLNTLDYERWHEVIDQDWIDIYNDGWKKLRDLRAEKNNNRDFNFDIVMANPPFAGDIKESRVIAKYELGKNSKGKTQSKVGRDILFIERNLQFLKAGGRMAIILPQGRFNNSSDKYIRDFIAERCRILAVVGLHGNVFKPHTGTKTSVLFVQKWDEKICPRREDYPIFFATMREPSKDNSGEKIFEVAEGKILRDNHNHSIIKHDLFNHDGLTRDGIVEAFIEFAKKESLSFFDHSSFDADKYSILLRELECTEKLLSTCAANKDFRTDSEFYIREPFKNKNFTYKKIGDCLLSSQYGISIYMNEDGAGFPIYRMNEIHNQLCDTTVKKFADISQSEFKIFELHDGDVLFNRTNSYQFVGRTGIYYSAGNEGKIFASYLVRLVCNEEFILPEYLTAYLNTKYGIADIKRRARQSINQTNVNPEEVKEIELPILPKDFQERIRKNFRQAYKMLLLADEKYKAAEKILSAELDLENFKPSTSNVAIKSFSSSFFATGRLDAEFYQPKYDSIENKLAELSGGKTVKDYFKLVKDICSRAEKFYNYVEIGDVNVGTGEAVANLIELENLPDNAKIMTQAGDIIVSKVRPNRGAVALLRENNLLVSGAFSVLRTKGKYFAEVLQVLLRLPIYRDLMLKFNVGTSYPVIKDIDVINLPLPEISEGVQEKICAQVEESFRLRRESKKLLESAKKLVENEIEKI